MPDSVDDLQQQTRAAFLQAFAREKYTPGTHSASPNAPDVERMARLIESHLDQASRNCQVRTTLPERMERMALFTRTPLKKLILWVYELLTREQRLASLAQLNALRDFLQLYTQSQWATNHALARADQAQQSLERQLQSLERLAASVDSQAQALATLQSHTQQLEQQLQASQRTVQLQGISLQRLLSSTSAVGATPALAEPAPTQTEQSAARYVAFEDHFRGSPEHVRQQFAQDYLPVLAQAGIGAGAQVLDIGCGRGEWLQLVREQQWQGRGVDLNPVVCALCQSQQLDVLHDDAVAYLARQPAGRLDVITAFHLIEHLPSGLLDTLLAAAFEALRPGGLLILETPNPENWIVGTCNFYNDPTHHHPLPPEPTRFRVQSHGFSSVEILRLHPRGEVDYAALPAGIPAELVERLFVGQDYALVARR